MIESTPNAAERTFATLAEAVTERLAQNKRVRRNLPGAGRLRIDRQLPFLCVYRCPPDRSDQGTHRLITTEAAYLFASGSDEYHKGLTQLCGSIVRSVREHFGVCLFLEIWTANLSPNGSASGQPDRPRFEIVARECDALPTTMTILRDSLQSIRIGVQSACVTISPHREVVPPGLPPLLPNCDGQDPRCFSIGVAVHPIYRDAQSGRLYPLTLQSLRRQFGPALRKAILAFTGIDENDPRLRFPSLGPSSLVRAAADADRQLSTASTSFDFVLQATPINAKQAWCEFEANHFRASPKLYYRPLPFDPMLLKRSVYEVPLERIEDATLAHLFLQKQDELSRQLTALQDLDTPNFLYSSLMIYGEPDAELANSAERLLRRLPRVERAPRVGGQGCREVVDAALAEIDRYREVYPSFGGSVEITEDIASGLMVTHDRLLVSPDIRVSVRRMRALMHHEIGTHLLTYVNGRAQRFRQMFAGLPGYESLQEGLAVLSEYLTGGLTAARMRTLAARVVAVKSLIARATFADTFACLHEEHGFAPRRSFDIAMRVYRGGGLTKDVIYLRGLCELLQYLRDGHEIEPLFVGKIALEHLPFIQDLRRRGVVHPPAILPRYLKRTEICNSLQQCRELTVEQLWRPPDAASRDERCSEP